MKKIRTEQIGKEWQREAMGEATFLQMRIIKVNFLLPWSNSYNTFVHLLYSILIYTHFYILIFWELPVIIYPDNTRDSRYAI